MYFQLLLSFRRYTVKTDQVRLLLKLLSKHSLFTEKTIIFKISLYSRTFFFYKNAKETFNKNYEILLNFQWLLRLFILNNFKNIIDMLHKMVVLKSIFDNWCYRNLNFIFTPKLWTYYFISSNVEVWIDISPKVDLSEWNWTVQVLYVEYVDI